MLSGLDRGFGHTTVAMAFCPAPKLALVLFFHRVLDPLLLSSVSILAAAAAVAAAVISSRTNHVCLDLFFFVAAAADVVVFNVIFAVITTRAHGRAERQFVSTLNSSSAFCTRRTRGHLMCVCAHTEERSKASLLIRDFSHMQTTSTWHVRAHARCYSCAERGTRYTMRWMVSGSECLDSARYARTVRRTDSLGSPHACFQWCSQWSGPP
jgi:hypothetical protein